MNKSVSIFWFRRDLRLHDNAGLYHALASGLPVVPVFVFDTEILDRLEDKHDARVVFIQRQLEKINSELKKYGSSLIVKHGTPIEVWKELANEFAIEKIFTNRDYEPKAIARDQLVSDFLKSKKISFQIFKDQVIFEQDEIVKPDGSPYTVFTPYKNKWMSELRDSHTNIFSCEKYFSNFFKTEFKPVIPLNQIGFADFDFEFPSTEIKEEVIHQYAETRNLPALRGTSRLSVHLRFGTVSIRETVALALKLNQTWLNELIWREFFMQILFHFPRVIDHCFKKQYEKIRWRNNESEFALWRSGNTGYPMVDAGMRELNETGFMHNRVRMVTASFLMKHLLCEWRWGEAYFAKKLLDYDLASNNGNWQWAAGTGCDAAPYFRIFNPLEQQKKFDPDFTYIRKWVPEFGSDAYPQPIVEHSFARERCLKIYKEALK